MKSLAVKQHVITGLTEQKFDDLFNSYIVQKYETILTGLAWLGLAWQ